MSGRLSEPPPRAEPPAPAPAGPQEPPPLLGSWPALYRLVLGSLALTVLVLYALARWAS